MKKYLLLTVLFIAACSSTPKSNQSSEDSIGLDGVTDAPTVQEESPKAKRDEPAPEVKAAPVASSQYSNLNAAIKSQSDEGIYRAATDILAQNGNDPRALNALAMYHYKKGRFDLSKYLLSKGIAANPGAAELYSNLGVVYMSQNERREAIKSFKKALSVNAMEPVASANVGSIYVQEKDYKKGLLALEMAYSKGVRDPRVLNNYAIALTATGSYEKAADLYKKVVKEDSNNREAMLNYAILLVDKMEKYKDGLEVISRLKFVGGPTGSSNRINALENKAKAGLK
ncbi:tetratricopeptide repeat protein [Bdellovibrio sp. SKB1291214]|uniref:tetratricopeptide repeat protein n=1 Tax=Bdellovibrio sp. SKB1291214 TaxID=1732569 RepID=UPI000B51DC55|nr:tetratricopeptide repeat protein [Bdellovibrio sp. SKB1291214]UYL08992.1 tetratricopeptide repeat protein [Bdellovibrio sp. SKB1291214]